MSIKINKKNHSTQPKTLIFVDPNVTDKPELLFFVRDFEQLVTHHKIWNGICHIKKNESKAKLDGKPFTSQRYSFEYDFREKTVYSYKHRVIEKLSVDHNVTSNLHEFNFSQTILRDGSINSISLDWITKNLYVIYAKRLMVLNVKDKLSTPKTLIELGESISSPTVKVFPNNGFIVIVSNG